MLQGKGRKRSSHCHQPLGDLQRTLFHEYTHVFWSQKFHSSRNLIGKTQQIQQSKAFWVIVRKEVFDFWVCRKGMKGAGLRGRRETSPMGTLPWCWATCECAKACPENRPKFFFPIAFLDLMGGYASHTKVLPLKQNLSAEISLWFTYTCIHKDQSSGFSHILLFASQISFFSLS